VASDSLIEDSFQGYYSNPGRYPSILGYRIFHADWGIRWKNGEQDYQVLIGFGCGEMKTSDGNVELTCDIWDSKIFEELLNPYHKLRPEAE